MEAKPTALIAIPPLDEFFGRVVQEPSLTKAPEQCQGDATRGAKLKKIVVVEDEQVILDLTVEVLEMNDYEVRAFTDAESAWEYMRNLEQTVDLLITDLRMPGDFDGIELTQMTRKYRPDLPVIIASGYHAESHELLATQIHWLQKPFDIPKLVEACASLTSGERSRVTR